MKIIKTKKSKNYSKHSNGKPKQYVKTAVMMHSTVGNFKGAIEWLCTTPEERLKKHGKKSWSSAHNIDDRDTPGVINQLMPLQYRSWHAGGVTRRSDRAKHVIGLSDPNNVCIGHEFVNYYDINRNGRTEDKERRLTESQINDFVDYMFFLEEESKTNKWLDIRADADHLLTHYDTNHHKPNMEKDYKKVVKAMKKARVVPSTPKVAVKSETKCSNDLQKATAKIKKQKTVIDFLLGIIRKLFKK